MSRAASGNMIMVKPRNNIYTVLAAAALIAVLVALVVVFVRAGTLFPAGSGQGSGGLL